MGGAIYFFFFLDGAAVSVPDVNGPARVCAVAVSVDGVRDVSGAARVAPVVAGISGCHELSATPRIFPAAFHVVTSPEVDVELP